MTQTGGSSGDAPTLLKAMSMATQLDEVVPQRLSLEDPRMVVAMQILGVNIQDLTAPTPPPPPPLGSDRSPRRVVATVPPARRAELWERKQYNLRREVEAEAKSLRVARILREAEREDESEMESDSERKLQALRDRSAQEVQRAIDTETEKLRAIQQCQERQEKRQKQVATRKAQHREELVKAMGIRQDLRTAQATQLEENVKKQKEENRKLVKKLKDSFRKVEEHRAERLDNILKAKEEREENARQVTERRETALQRDQEEMVQEYLLKEARTQQRLQLMRENEAERAMQGESEYLEKLEKSLAQIQAKQRKKEDDFLERLERHKKGMQFVVNKHEDVKAEAKKYWTEKVSPVLEKKREEDERLRKRAGKKSKKHQQTLSPLGRTKYVEEELLRRAEQRQTMDELVYRNMQRLQRSQDFKAEQLLSRIEETNARTERMQEKRNFESLQRETVLKEALIEKARVQDELRTMKVLPPPPESEEKEKEAK